MSQSHPAFSVEECKIQASILLKSLRSADIKKAHSAAKRFQKLSAYSNLSYEEIIKSDIKRKDALTVIAIEKGFTSWSELKCQLPFIRGGFLNQWFKKYDDAKKYLQSQGGFLLPYQNQFFVCDIDYINHLGFNSDDSDWKLIDFDWVKPKDQIAFQRLCKKWMRILEGNRHE